MNGFNQENSTASPPAPPARGLSSYNGVRAGSFASFGHVYPNDLRAYGPPLIQQVTFFPKFLRTPCDSGSLKAHWVVFDNFLRFLSGVVVEPRLLG